MHDDTTLVEDRITHLRQRVAEHTYRVLAPVTVHAWEVPGEPVPFAQAHAADDAGRFRPLPAGTWWGRPWSTWWMRLDAQVPDDLAPEVRQNLELRIDLGFEGDWAGNQSEGMVLTTSGHPLKAVNPMNRTVRLGRGRTAEDLAHAGAPLIGQDGGVHLYVEAAANPNLGEYMNRPSPDGDLSTRRDTPLWQFRGADLVVRDEAVWHLGLDLEVLDGLMRTLPGHSTHRAVLLRALERVVDQLDDDGVVAGAAAAHEALVPQLASGANSSAQRFSAVGHAHIDSAWLWPLRETRRKIVRTWSNVVALAEEYPDFHFACTSAQQYQWLKEGSPALFERVRELIANGQWHVVGGMWVEPDTNLPSGEALVRQLTTGLRWMRRELGVRPRCLWLPDSFGYTGALPQIARLAGMEWFFTQKMSWNQTNTLPHHSFWWEGIDGTRIWTHFPPVDCYDSVVSLEEVVKAERGFRDKGRTPYSLLPFGYGDGGGGPTREMVERVRRLADLEDAPRVVLESPDDFYRRAMTTEAEAPVWRGEMYLEFHRGVYTSNHLLKQGNRRTESGLAAAEWLWVLAAVAGAPYPEEELERLWQRACLLQFHDILPGSSIAWVNREAREEYARLATELADLTARAWSHLTGQGAPAAATTDEPDELSVVNPSPHPRRQVVSLPATPARAHTDEPALVLVDLPPRTVLPLSRATTAPSAPVTVTRVDEEIVLDNGIVRATIDAAGEIAGLRDLRAGRELVIAGARANRLTIHPDRPSCFDAWELQAQYRHRGEALTHATAVEVTIDTPVRAQVTVRRAHGSSTIIQTVTLDADSASLDLTLDISWRERARVLRTEFPLALRATRSVGEIQFGAIERPVSSNTSWEEAQFETSAHRWLLLGEPGYAVGLVNESSYGYDARPTRNESVGSGTGTVVGLTLLRSPQAPDPGADLGDHHLAYRLLLDADRPRVRASAEALNEPALLLPGHVEIPTIAQVTTVNPATHAVIDTVKAGFDDAHTVVLRLHEDSGAHSEVDLALGLDASRIIETDLLEDPVGSPTQVLPTGPVAAGTPVRLHLHPYQVLTLKVVRS